MFKTIKNFIIKCGWLFIFLYCFHFSAKSEKFQVFVSLNQPPYLCTGKESGIELDIITQVLTIMGKDFQFILSKYPRSKNVLKMKGIDAFTTVNENFSSDSTILSDVYITYQDAAISLKKNNFSLKTIDDLSKYSIASFYVADDVFSEDYVKAVNNSPLYLKTNPHQQVKLLLNEKIEVIVMDINIFNYIYDQLTATSNKPKINYDIIFQPVKYRMAFKSVDEKIAFNKALKIFNRNNGYQKIIKKYKSNMSANCLP